jgi:hypothetical protein
MASSRSPENPELPSSADTSAIELSTGRNNEPSANTEDTISLQAAADSTNPNGGYGWVVVFACAILTFWFVGTTYSWGVIQASLVREGLTSASTLSFVGSLTVAFNAILALVSARVIKLLGARITGCLGILFLSAGEILSGFSTHNVGGLFVTTGVIMGVGVRYVVFRTATITFQN